LNKKTSISGLARFPSQRSVMTLLQLLFSIRVEGSQRCLVHSVFFPGLDLMEVCAKSPGTFVPDYPCGCFIGEYALACRVICRDADRRRFEDVLLKSSCIGQPLFAFFEHRGHSSFGLEKRVMYKIVTNIGRRCLRRWSRQEDQFALHPL